MLNVTPAHLLRLGLFYTLSALAVRPAAAANRFVPAGGDLQGALNQAQRGDTITLAAGATFVGNFTLSPNKAGNKWITIQSSAMNNLPGPGQRVSPAQAPYMPKLMTPNAGAVLTIPSGANYYRIQGVEFTVAPGVYVNGLIQAGTTQETAVNQLPHDLDFDRDYIHGDPVSGSKRGLALNSAAATVENSYFMDFTSDWQDTQAICGWNGPGPYTIQNNHLEAGAEIVAFGGAVPSIPGVIPANILIQNNEFYKPMSWWGGAPNYIGRHIRAKNHIEFKNGKNAVIQNNTFTNNFVGADQLGFTILLNVRDELGQVPWATVSNITVKNNRFEHVAAGVLMSGRDADGGGTAGNFTLSNNTWLDMGGYGGDGRMYQIQSHVDGLTIDHETAFPTGWFLVFAYEPSSGLKITNSIFTAGAGIAGDGGHYGEDALALYEPDGILTNNAFIGAWPWGFTGAHFGANWLLGSASDVGFVDFTRNNVLLAANSPLKGQATDGLDLGSNLSTASSAPITTALGSTTSVPAPNGWVSLVSKSSGNCVDDPGSSTTAGTALISWSCTGNANQQFQFWPVYDGYKISNRASGLQFDLAGGPSNLDAGASLLQWPYWGGANEMFELSEPLEGYVMIRPVHSQLCLELANDGGSITQQACTGADNQLWKLVPAQ